MDDDLIDFSSITGDTTLAPDYSIGLGGSSYSPGFSDSSSLSSNFPLLDLGGVTGDSTLPNYSLTPTTGTGSGSAPLGGSSSSFVSQLNAAVSPITSISNSIGGIFKNITAGNTATRTGSLFVPTPGAGPSTTSSLSGAVNGVVNTITGTFTAILPLVIAGGAAWLLVKLFLGKKR